MALMPPTPSRSASDFFPRRGEVLLSPIELAKRTAVFPKKASVVLAAASKARKGIKVIKGAKANPLKGLRQRRRRATSPVNRIDDGEWIRPSPPRNVQLIKASQNALVLRWDMPTHTTGKRTNLRYTLQVEGIAHKGRPHRALSICYRGPELQHAERNLMPGTVYRFRVKAESKYGTSAYSPFTSFRTLKAQAADQHQPASPLTLQPTSPSTTHPAASSPTHSPSSSFTHLMSPIQPTSLTHPASSSASHPTSSVAGPQTTTTVFFSSPARRGDHTPPTSTTTSHSPSNVHSSTTIAGDPNGHASQSSGADGAGDAGGVGGAGGVGDAGGVGGAGGVGDAGGMTTANRGGYGSESTVHAATTDNSAYYSAEGHDNVREYSYAPPLRTRGVWAEYWDERYEHCYYYNRHTCESRWGAPPYIFSGSESEMTATTIATSQSFLMRRYRFFVDLASADPPPTSYEAAMAIAYPSGQRQNDPGGEPDPGKGRWEVTEELAPSFYFCVRRDHVVRDSIEALGSFTRAQWLHSRLKVRFHNEEGLDAGGLLRDWFLCVSKALCATKIDGELGSNPDAKDNSNADASDDNAKAVETKKRKILPLFQQTSAGLLLATITGRRVPHNTKRAVWFLGVIAAKAMRSRVQVYAPLHTVLLKHLKRDPNLRGPSPFDFADIAAMDPELHRSLTWMLEHSIEDSGMEMTFTAPAEHLVYTPGVAEPEVHIRDVELVPDGSTQRVTDANKGRYINKLLVEWHCEKRFQTTLTLFRRGFQWLLPPRHLTQFTLQEVGLLINARSTVDVDFLKSSAVYSGLDAETQVVVLFWELLSSMTQSNLHLLLRFWTGYSNVPLDGYDPPLHISHTSAGSDSLVRAHTCFNQLMLPPYKSAAEMRDKILYALRNCDGFQFA